MKLVIMTRPTFFVEEDKILVSLFDEGMENLHINKQESSPLYTERLLSLIPEEYYKKITVHQHFYLKEEYGLAGIHLDSETDDIPTGYKGKVSRTCSNLENLKAIKKKSNRVFLRNIFDSTSTKDEYQSFSEQQLKDASRSGLIDKNVYALSGMNIDNIKMAKDLGFGGVVISGDIWNRFDIHNQQDFIEVINHFKKLRRIVG